MTYPADSSISASAVTVPPNHEIYSRSRISETPIFVVKGLLEYFH